MSFQETDIKEYLELLGAKKSAPGGGSALALVLETAASLGMMVCNFTLNKKGYEHLNEYIQDTMEKLEKIKNRAAELMDEDCSSFARLMEAFKLKNEKQISDAAFLAAKVPYDLYTATKVLQPIVEKLSEVGNKNVVSDAMIAVDLCKSIYPGCILNINANIPYILDEEKKQSLSII